MHILKGVSAIPFRGFLVAVRNNSRFLVAILLFSLVFIFEAECLAQDSAPSEYQIKAAFLFNFAKFVDWPPETYATPTTPIIIGVLGDNVFGNNLERTLNGKTINNRPLQYKELHSPLEATNCQILFICPSEKAKCSKIIEGLRGTSILTVSETDQFIHTGGMVNFFIDANKIRFEINDEAAKKAGLKISSKLMSLAGHPH